MDGPDSRDELSQAGAAGEPAKRGDTSAQHRSAVHDLRIAAEKGDPASLAAVLDRRVVMLIDGGGVVPADPRPFRGPTDVAHKICDVLENDPAVITEREVNGQRGLVLLRRGRVTAVVGISVRKRKVTELWVVLNPNKLRRWNIAPAHPPTG